MKLTIDLPGKVFDKLVALAISEYRHTPQQAAIIERYLRKLHTAPQKRREPLKQQASATVRSNVTVARHNNARPWDRALVRRVSCTAIL